MRTRVANCDIVVDGRRCAASDCETFDHHRHGDVYVCSIHARIAGRFEAFHDDVVCPLEVEYDSDER